MDIISFCSVSDWVMWFGGGRCTLMFRRNKLVSSACSYAHESILWKVHCFLYEKVWEICLGMWVWMCACECGLEDGSKPVQVFEGFPGSFLLCLRLEGGRLRVKECTDVLSESAVFELSPQQRNPNPNTWASDYRLMPHLDLLSQNTKGRMKSSAWYRDQKSNTFLIPLYSFEVRAVSDSKCHLRLILDGDFLCVEIICPEFNKSSSIHDCKFNHHPREVNAVHFWWLTT